MKKKILLLSAKYADIPFVNVAKNMGYYVVSTGNRADQPVHSYSDEYVPFNYMDHDGMVELAKKLEISAVCQGCTDACALTASYIGDKLRLKGHDTYQNTQIIHLKDEFKKFTNSNNILSPKTDWFDDKEKALMQGKKYDWPMIIKPVDLGGGQGISIANNFNEYGNAVIKAFEKSLIGRIVVEPYISGSLHSMSTFLIRQKVVAYGTANDYSFKNRYLTNTGSFPATDYEEAVKILVPEVEKIAKLLGLVDGLLHFQYILDEKGQPWIIEMMRRIPGNNFLVALSHSVGLNWYEWIIRAEAGEPCHLIPQSHIPHRIYGYHSAMAKKDGIFKGIRIAPELKQYVIQLDYLVEEGHSIKDYMTEKLANIQYGFYTVEEKEKYLPKINSLVEVLVD